jgi:hypothetical protein
MATTSEPRTRNNFPSGWRGTLSHVLSIKGFASAAAYAESRSEASIVELCFELGPATTAAQLERALVMEAEASGTLERCARDLLARDLRAELPAGWPGVSDQVDDETCLRKAGVFHHLMTILPDRYASTIEHIQHAMDALEIPTGWLPDGAADGVLIEIFGNYWPAAPT